jgi:hypothetical protein
VLRVSGGSHLVIAFGDGLAMRHLGHLPLGQELANFALTERKQDRQRKPVFLILRGPKTLSHSKR